MYLHTLSATRSSYCAMLAQGANEKLSAASAGAQLGQGATEYLVLLAVVLIVALISVALLGSFTGTVSDAQMEQSRTYWASQQPIAIVDGAASNHGSGSYEEYNKSQNTVLLRLRNTGAYPIQLIGVTTTGRATGSIDYGICHFRLDLGELRVQFFDPCLDESGTYSDVFIGPPRGDGFRDNYDGEFYSNENILQPGEEISIGYSVWGIAITGSSPLNYGVLPCSDKHYGSWDEFTKGTAPLPLSRKNMEIETFNIYYYSIVDGKKVLKKTTGAKPLVLPCTDTPLWE